MCVCVCVCACVRVFASVWGREEGKQNMGEINLILRRTAVKNMGLGCQPRYLVVV